MHVKRYRLSLVFSLGLAILWASFGSVRADEKQDEYYELMKVFVDSFEQIERNYVKEVDRRELIESAIRGMIADLDQYSNYISPGDLDRFTQSVEQEFGGIGIQVQLQPETRQLMVMTPLPGTPAYKAGVLAGDTIVEIEGQPTAEFDPGQELETAVKLLKGPAGEEVTIGIRHEGAREVQTIKIVRDIIQVATVLGDTYGEGDKWNFMLNGETKIGYVRLTHFSRHSAEELTAALEELTKEGLKGLILDLRFNPGGLLSQATEISDLFIESGRIVSTRGRNTDERAWDAHTEGTFSGFPMAIIVNRFSASASEIVSACLQDHKRAMIVGERTWGKGSVQNVIELEGGSSALKLTTASYHRPSGKNIHRFPGAKETDEWGVMPTEGYLLKLPPQEMQAYLKYRQERDVLAKTGPPKNDFEDRQLALALKYLHEQLGLAPAATPAEAKSDEKKDGDKPASESKPEKDEADKGKPAKPESSDEPKAEEKPEAPDDDDAASLPTRRLIPRTVAT